ncbi:group-specific protein [Oceanobacillus picturae]|uniref:group-specific protein n=1 Tax=Oceanobacillus picturae TaxID=171693 RepID=UPI000E697F44|nr:group-specific protein [Oceanobacillus picturae]RIU93382.1 group-specific protein [Oceanobacillus picturae]
MKYYIASSFQNKENVQAVSQYLFSKGHVNTYDWTLNERANTVEQLERIGTLEKQAVADCDLFILYLPGGKGSHVELGLALAYGKKVIMYREKAFSPEEASSFYYVEGVHHVIGGLEKLFKLF